MFTTKLHLISILSVLKIVTGYSDLDETCTVDPGFQSKATVDVNMIILVDRSQFMAPLRKSLAQKLKYIFQPSINAIKGKWTFAVVGFSNWDSNDNNNTSCFEVIADNITKDGLRKLQDIIAEIKPVSENITRSGLSHLALASHFFTSKADNEGQCNITKCHQTFTYLLIFTNFPAEMEENVDETEEEYVLDKEQENACDNKPPTLLSIQKSFFFTKESQRVIGFLSSNDELDSYKEVLDSVDVPFCGDIFSLQKVDTKKFENVIKRCIEQHYQDFTKGRCVYLDPPGENTLSL